MKELKLATFDMDGLLLDTERWSLNAFRQIGKEMGYVLNEAELRKGMGRKIHKDADLKKIFAGSQKQDIEVLRHQVYQRLDELKNELYLTGVDLRPGVMGILHYLKDHNVPCMVASSSMKEKVMMLLNKTAIKDLFTDYLSGDDIENGKPDPEIFLKSCEKAGVDKKDVIIFEDSDNGALACMNAGIRYVLVPDIAYVSEKARKNALICVGQIDQSIGKLKTVFDNLD